jgi:hypothetical protein
MPANRFREIGGLGHLEGDMLVGNESLTGPDAASVRRKLPGL